ncbi:MAG: imidazoleglycerol-phosphate dehydratase HisB [Armatimonadetes bacterium CG07_land_8_20_14_0_80_40_9]|nr:MAG: imidazoleglycerol-phosphate dehydratase HisB [Armatimonadetes bacterium CG07_land_8_20_14_0_80_40_9]
MVRKRVGKVERRTKETYIKIELDLDGSGEYKIDTSIQFLDHMLSLFAKHGLFDLKIKARGDTEVDYHHLVEDIGICLGEAIDYALKEKVGIIRYGEAFVPMDEALVLLSLDLSGRPYLAFDLILKRRKVGTFDTELVEEFFRALASSAKVTLHLRQFAGRNTHHLIEAAFKALGRALGRATEIDKRIKGIPSTKGKL